MHTSTAIAGPGGQNAASTEHGPRTAELTARQAGQSPGYPIVAELEAAAKESASPGIAGNDVGTKSHGATGNGLDLRHQILKDRPADPPLQPGLDESGWHILKQQVGLKDSDVPLNKHRPPRWSEWLGTAPEVKIITDLTLSRTNDSVVLDDLLVLRCRGWRCRVGKLVSRCGNGSIDPSYIRTTEKSQDCRSEDQVVTT